MKPVSISIYPWTNIILDYLTKFLSNNGYNAVFIVIKQLTKEKYYILCIINKKGITVKVNIYLLLDNIKKIYNFFCQLLQITVFSLF